MSEPSRDERIALWREVTGVEDDHIAIAALTEANWDVQTAVHNFLSSGMSTTQPVPRAGARVAGNRGAGAPGSGGPHRRAASPPTRDERAEADDDAQEDEALLGGREAPHRAPAAPAAAPGSAAAIVTLPFKAIGLLMKVALWPLRLVTTNREASPQEAASQFIECIKRDYGARQPDFFRGPFQRAAQQAQREKKYLIVYIHSPLHEDTPAFCRQTLTAETFVAFANDSALVWGGSVQQSDAYALSSKLETTCFPFLALIACQGRSLEVLCRLEGSLTVEQVMDRMTAAMAQHQEGLERQAEQQRQRDERIRLQEEQNREYQEALEADRRREAAAAAEKERREREEAEERARAEREAALAKALAEEREASLRRKRAALPAEPDAPAPFLKLRLQFPQGAKADRRFSPDDTLQVVRDFVDVYVADNAMPPLHNFSLSANFPRRTFDDMAVSLRDAGLHSADTIYIADLDA